ncbi:MAG: anti-sigma factor [Gemmatimonadetes bacterium]|nr:anti-sigma factor [Gemmatimonadota bacterium]
MNDHDQARLLLNELIDGELDAEQRQMVEAHVENCASCTDEVEALLVLQARVGELPGEIMPPRDLWNDISERLQPASPSGVIPLRRAVRTPRPRWHVWTAMAAAASVLIALSSAVTMQLLSRQDAPVVATAPDRVSPEQRPQTAMAAFEPMQREYLGTLAELEAELQARRGSLSPQSVAVIEENLQIIDQAIIEIREALRTDSSSVELPLLLSGVYRAKVDLLESVLRLNAQT